MSRMPDPRSLDVFPSCMGGHTVEANGYVFEFSPTHPRRNGWGFVPQHRLVAEQMLGRPLARDEVVHHVDHDRHNNHPDNLHVMTQGDHRRLHAQELAEIQKARLTEYAVSAALQGRSLKAAAALLNVHTQTLRNRFPDLVAPRKRKSPTQIEDALVIDLIREVAPDPLRGFREIAREHHISFRTVQRICERNGIPWVKKTKKGEKHSQYRRKNTIPAA